MRSAMSSGVTNLRFSQLGATESQPFAKRAADGVCRDEYPLPAGEMGRAKTSELGDKWIHATSLRRSAEREHRGCEPAINHCEDGGRDRVLCIAHPRE